MARVVKDADVRRKELLDAALRLFESVGYERTSVEQITAEVGVAKGTFYHYFTSKQDLLTQLVTSWADELFERLEREPTVAEGDAVSRLKAFFQRASEWKLQDRETAIAYGRSLYSDDNLRLRHALWDGWLERTERTLATIVAAGVAEGVFDVADTEATTQVLATLWFGWSDRQSERLLSMMDDPSAAASVAAGLEAVETAMERILGLHEGTLNLGLGTYVERIVEDR
jgi:AcrR family transcriptional regulator